MLIIRFYELSLFRAQLMGLSIILIVLFHAFVDYCPIMNFGFIGVEFFLLVSAIGLYFSLLKKPSLKEFYKRRFIRIFPAYVLIAVPYLLVTEWGKYGLFDYFLVFFGFGELRHEIIFWFVGLICICYLIAPFYYKLLKYRYSILLPFVTLVVGYNLGRMFPEMEIMFNRFAVFFLGFHLAQLVHSHKEIRSFLAAFACLIAVVLVVYIGSLSILVDLKRVAFFFLSIPSLFFLVFILHMCPQIIHRLLTFIGGLTLEIYLVHASICMIVLKWFFGYVMVGVLLFPCSLLVAYILKKFVAFCIDKLLPKKLINL